MTGIVEIHRYSGTKDNHGSRTYIQYAIDRISKSDELKRTIKSLRTLLDEARMAEEVGTSENEVKALYAAADESKKKLEAVTWSGIFAQATAIKNAETVQAFMKGQITWSDIKEKNLYMIRTRKAEQLMEYSGFICLDIDKLPDSQLALIKERLRFDKYAYFTFTSPSGTGLKVLIRVDGGPQEHANNFLALEKYFLHEYQQKIDPSGKDVSRLCFLSFDADCIINTHATVFSHRNYIVREPRTPTLLSKKEEQKFYDAPADDLQWIREFTDNKLTYAKGSRNNYIHLFACNCNRKGVDISECLTYVSSFAHDLDINEITATIKSAYENNSAEAGKYAKRQSIHGENKVIVSKSSHQGSKPPVPPTNDGHKGIPEGEEGFIQFWYVTEDEKRKDSNGEPLKKYQLIYNKLILFMEAAGYYRLQLANKSYQYIRFIDNVCEPIGLIHMKDYVFSWLRGKDFSGVLEMMRRGAKAYFTPQVMEGLEYKQIEFGKDTATEAFFYFKNCVACVTAEGIKTLPYTESQKAIWGSSMIQREFKPVTMDLPFKPDGVAEKDVFDKCEMAKYILLVSHSPNSSEEISEIDASQRFLSICSSIGYMLHGYKSRVAKAVIAVDHKIPEDKSEQNGGTGKSIVGESFKYLKSTTIIDGREFKEDYPFRFEMVGVDTKVVVMQDCRYNLDFGSFFVPITNDFTYNRRHTGYITLPFNDAPKWWFDTNFVFKGEGASFRRRMHVVEFDDYFHENYTPLDEFGHFLFQDWDDQQWNWFYNFYMYCVQLYLSCGLIDYPKSNYESRKLVSESPAEFIDFIDATEGENNSYKIKRNAWFEKKELLKQWNNEAKEMGMQATTAHLLTKWMKKYCTARPFRLLKDKTNGVEYWLLADSSYKGIGKRSEGCSNPRQPDLPF